MKKITLYLCLLFLTYTSFAQDIELTNPSFEDTPRVGVIGGQAPRGWYNCGPEGETAPDVHSNNNDISFFDVTHEADHGETFVGMVTRDNETYESIGQRLRKPLKEGATYQFKIRLAMSEEYRSRSRKTDLSVDYTTPVVLRVWGGTKACGKTQMLAETEAIDHTEWLQYTFTFEPDSEFTYLVLEAFWNTPVMFAYNGSLLLDNCSRIYELYDSSNSSKGSGVAKNPVTEQLKTEGPIAEGSSIKNSIPRTEANQAKHTDSLKETTELEPVKLSPEFVKSSLNICQEKKVDVDENGYRLMKILFLRRAFKLEEMSMNTGFEKYMAATDSEELGLAVRALKKLKADKTANLLNELKNIQAKESAKETLNTKEIDLSKNAELLFKANAKEENLSDLIKNYILENDKAIRKELNYCQK